MLFRSEGSTTDPKFAVVARRTGQPVAFVIAVWAQILERASASKERGCIDGYDCATTANLGSVVDPSNHRNHSITSSPIRRSWTGTARKPPPLQTSSVPLKTGFRLRPGRRAHGTTPYRYAPGEARRPTRQDRKSTRLNSSHIIPSRMPSSA